MSYKLPYLLTEIACFDQLKFTWVKCPKVSLLPPPPWLTSNFQCRRHFEIQFVFGAFKRQHSLFHGVNSCGPELQQQMQVVCVYLVRCFVFIALLTYISQGILGRFFKKKATFYCLGLNLSHQLKQDLRDKEKM